MWLMGALVILGRSRAACEPDSLRSESRLGFLMRASGSSSMGAEHAGSCSGLEAGLKMGQPMIGRSGLEAGLNEDVDEEEGEGLSGTLLTDDLRTAAACLLRTRSLLSSRVRPRSELCLRLIGRAGIMRIRSLVTCRNLSSLRRCD